MKMTRCATCDALIVEGATFCGQCGTVIGNVFEPTVRSSKPSHPDIRYDSTINISEPTAQLRNNTQPAPQAQFRAPEAFQANVPVTPPPLQPLSEQDIATIRRDDERTYDVSAAYYDEMRGRVAQHPTGPLPPPQAPRDEEKQEERYYLPGAGLLGSGAQGPFQTVPANPGVPHFGSAPSAQGIPQVAHNMQNMPMQPQFSQHQNMPQQHVQANRATLPAHAFAPNKINRPATAVRRAARVNPIAIGAVIAAAVVAVMIGVGALIITHASNTPGPKVTVTPAPTRTPIIFHPAMKVSGSMLPGSTITLHGADFPPGGHVIFKLDGAPLNSAMVTVAPLATYGPVAPVAQADMRQEATSGTVVKSDGTFDTHLTIPSSWQGGSQHHIQAAVQGTQGEVHVDLTVQVQQPGVTPTPVKTTCIAVSSNQLSFTGVKGKSDPAAQQIKISNCGDTGTWKAQTATDEGGNWLSLDTTDGTLASGKNTTLTVTTSNLHGGLAAGTYSGHITFTLGSSAETVDVSLSVSSNPCISANTNALSFTGVTAVSDPATQSVTISNCGDDEGWSSAISTSDGNNWLGIDSSNGTLGSGASKTITVTASDLNAQLSAGTYHGTITFSAGQQSAKVAVTLVVLQAPCIKADQTSLAFSGVAGTSDPTASQQVTLTNCGAYGDWASAVAYDDTSSGWLSSDTGASLNSGATQAVKVTASNLTAQLAAGTYKGHVTYTITTGTGTKPVVVGVTLTVYAKPCITASPTTFTFSGVVNTSDPKAQTETLADCGDNGNWTATVSSAAASWLSLDTTSGSLSASSPQQTLNVTASNLTGKLSAGTYTGTLTYTITTAHGGTASATASVTLTVYNPPCFQFTQINGQTASNATTDSLTFNAVAGQSNPSSQAVTLNNCGDSGTWSANVTSGSSWLSTGSTSGTLSASTSQDVTIAAANQSAGTYTGQIVFTLTTPGGTASITLNVTLTVLPGPCIQVTNPSSGSLSFSGTARTATTNSQTVTIANCGAGGTWSVAATTKDGASWLSALTSSEAASGSLSAGSSVDLGAWADSSSLTAGTYTGTLTFTMTASNGTGSSTAQVSVTFTVQAAACINVADLNGQPPSGSTPDTLIFNTTYGSSTSPSAQSVTLANCGGDGTVSASITYTSGSNWLSTDLTNGTSLSAGGTLNVNVGATMGSLTVAQYTATIRFTITTSSGTTYYQDVNVVFNVNSPGY